MDDASPIKRWFVPLLTTASGFSVLAYFFAGSIFFDAPQGPLPQLLIDPDGISVSGMSAGADLAVQLQVAYSSTFAGVGVFAGQAYHCAVHDFKGETLVEKTWWRDEVPYCDSCPPGKSLPVDHCKSYPERTRNADDLVTYAKSVSSAGKIDPTRVLATRRIYLYRGKSDTVYLKGAVNTTANFFRQFVPQEAVHFETSIDSPHAMPGINSILCVFEMWWGKGSCSYDGAGEALKWIYGADALSQGRDGDTKSLFPFLVPFNQRLYFPEDGRDPLLADDGLLFIPENCYRQRCKLHVFLHGCGVQLNYAVYPKYAGFNEWAVRNNIVILYPKMSWRGTYLQQRLGCYDGYGQTGHDYDLKSGSQMETIYNMVKALLNASRHNSSITASASASASTPEADVAV